MTKKTKQKPNKSKHNTQTKNKTASYRLSLSAYISMWRGLMVGSMTTHDPPLSSACGGMYTSTGCLYSLSPSTIYAPNFSTWSYMSEDRRALSVSRDHHSSLKRILLHFLYHWPFIPPEKPLQLANTMSGSPSLLKSLMACAVLKAESGNHTCPACWMIYQKKHRTLVISLKEI